MSTAAERTTHLRLVAAYFAANLQAKLEYRTSFVTQVLAMFLNDGLWLAFWALYFTQFPVVAGWRREDVIALWSVLALSFGLVHTFFGNLGRLSQLISEGQLDLYLLQPKNVLLHVLISDLSVPAMGDCLFGLATFLLLLPVTPARLAFFLFASLLGALLLLSFGLLAHALSFFVGNAENFATQLSLSLVHFASYPTGIFQGWTRVLLFTALPAGFISSAPVRLVRQFDPRFAGLSLAVSLLFAAAAVGLFHAGLRRYESGNLSAGRL